MTLKLLAQHQCFGGQQYIYSHHAAKTHSIMRFGLFLPPQALHTSVPALYWLSGLTCTEENFVIKAGAQRTAAELGIALIVPDTSPRGLNLPGDSDSFDFGVGASFYIDATLQPWSTHYRMYSYISQELPAFITANFPIDDKRKSIFGHSMGGHGALMIALRNQQHYQSVSAFAPICSLMQSPWGQKALSRYLGTDKKNWNQYDVTHLLQTNGWSGPSIFIDQGLKDVFLTEQLNPELLKQACEKANIKLNLRLQPDYDHSYFFISTFMEDHIRFHAQYL